MTFLHIFTLLLLAFTGRLHASQFEKQNDEKIVHLLNQEHKSLQELGIGSQQIQHFLKRNGTALEILTLHDIEPNVALAYVKLCPNLRSLCLTACNLQDAQAITIAHYPLPYLTELDLRSNYLSSDAVEEIAANMVHLQSLDLRYNDVCLYSKGIGGDGATFIANGHLRRLRTLKLDGVGNRGALALAKSKNLPHLHSLDLSHSGITDLGIYEFSQALKGSALQELTLQWNMIHDIGALMIALNLPHLTVLDLTHNSIGDRGVCELALHLKNIQKLTLSQCALSDESITALASSEARHLTHLNLSYNSIEDQGASLLADAKRFPNLQWLNLKYNAVRQEGEQALQERTDTETELYTVRYHDSPKTLHAQMAKIR